MFLLVHAKYFLEQKSVAGVSKNRWDSLELRAAVELRIRSVCQKSQVDKHLRGLDSLTLLLIGPII